VGFEDDLRYSLRREPAPPDFAVKVLASARALEAPQPKLVVMPVWRRPATWAIAAGITLAALIPPGVMKYRQEQQAKAAEAGRQLALALDITRTQLQKTKERLQKASKQHAL
jgi:hypothetical protein